MTDEQVRLLEEECGWIVESHSPLEISLKDSPGSRATGYAAEYIVVSLLEFLVPKSDCLCFSCERNIECACGPGISAKTGDVIPGDPWETPNSAVVFDGGWNFGSSFVRIVVCDDCLRDVKKCCKNKLREIPVRSKK
jgi:hypothetical protein